ncbi:MAG: FAD-binding oxidoreductase [Candidatus Latescibacterota bacterium]|jgi:FAD/FMN-containing dehydrogenase
MSSQENISEFATNLRGRLVTPSDSDYDAERAVYNGMIDRHPALIAKCADVGDVQTCVRFGHENDVRVSIRSGGHNAAGLGVCDDGLVIDLSEWKSVRVDPSDNTIRAEPGCTLGDLDHATHPYGLAVPTGMLSTTGVGGLALGGGVGHLSRKYGLTVDNIIEADVVLADGSIATANKDQHKDLFWAIRGGGGNFGVITSFKFQGHPVSTIVGGPVFWEIEKSAEVLKWYREFILNAPEDLNGFFAFLQVPPVDPFPDFAKGQHVCGIVFCYTGPAEKADEVYQPVKEFGPPLMFGVQPMPFPALQSAFDVFYPKGDQWYWRADFFDEISDEAIEAHVKYGKVPTGQSTMHLYPIDGAASRVDSDATAFAYRDANWAGVIVGVDGDPANKDLITDWTKDYYDALHPYSSGGAYVNFMMDEGQDRVKASFRDNYDRLARVKAKYDPDNFFNVNQNIVPA